MIYIYISYKYRWYIEYVHLPRMSSIGVSPIFTQNRIKENRTFSARCYATPWPHNQGFQLVQSTATADDSIGSTTILKKKGMPEYGGIAFDIESA